MDKQIRWLLKEKYNNKPTKQFYKDIERLNGDEPLDYVIGFTKFGAPPGSCKIDLSKKPLIPRPETEFWVKEAIKEIRVSSEFTPWRKFCHKHKIYKIRVLDIFSGSGCIGVAVLKHIKNSKVDFSDSDKNCLEQIKINLKINKIKENRFKAIQSDVFKNIKSKYDFIFANPPYVAVKNKNKIQKSVLKYEPRQALFGGGDGLFYIRKFLKQAKNYLNSGGVIFMEFSPEQKKQIEKLILKYKYKNYKFYKDQHKRWRWAGISNE